MNAMILQQPGAAAGSAISAVLFAIAIVIMAISAYFFPTILGWKKQNRKAIFALNLLLGFTVIGWVVALVWALSKDVQPTVVVIPESAAKK